MTPSRSDVGRQADDVDEPAAPLRAAVGERQDEVVGVAGAGLGGTERRQALPVPAGHACAVGEHLVEPLELGDAERRLDVGQPVVETDPLVRHDLHPRRAALVALAAGHRRGRLGVPGTSMPPSPVVICLLA